MLNASMFYGHNYFSAIYRWIRSKTEQILHSHFGMGWVYGPKSKSLAYVQAANPWIALSFSAITIGLVRRISWRNSRNLGISHGLIVIQSRHPCKDPANERPPGFSFVIKAIFSDSSLSALINHLCIHADTAETAATALCTL